MHTTPVRQRILETATLLFSRQGINNTGINQIISESKVAKASFYQYFPSKANLVVASLHEYDETISAALRRLSAGSRSVSEFFKKWTRLIIKNARVGTSFFGCPVANLGFQVNPNEHMLAGKFNEIIDGWFAILRPLFEKSVGLGEIPEPVDLQNLFSRIFAVNEGALVMWRLTGKKEHLANIYPIILSLMKQT